MTRPLPFLSLAGVDVLGGRDTLAEILRTWTAVAAALTAGRAAPPAPPTAPHLFTITFGFGPSLFTGDRFGIAARRPAQLRALPDFPRDALDPADSDGDLAVQVCAADPATAQLVLRALLGAARPQVRTRWRQTGFRVVDGTIDPRNLFGFRDETANLDVSDLRMTQAHLWVGDGPAWLHGGSYLVVRRIRLLLDTWDRMSRTEQEAVIGRDRGDNHRLARKMEPAHADLAAPQNHGEVRLLRRSYSYEAGIDPNGLLDSGVIFICYQQDPHTQFAAVQQRLAALDPLNGFSQHRASALFACPPAPRAGTFVGADLLS